MAALGSGEMSQYQVDSSGQCRAEHHHRSCHPLPAPHANTQTESQLWAKAFSLHYVPLGRLVSLIYLTNTPSYMGACKLGY